MSRSARSGFTLAEVAVTIAIVGIALVLCLQGLNGSKLQAAYTRNYRLARELAMQTLGEVGSGMHAEDIEDGMEGSYADRDYPQYTFELVVGDDTLSDTEDDSWDKPHDSWEKDEDEDEDEEAEQPYEKVKIRVRFPPIQDYPDELVLEQWYPWNQVYGTPEEQEDLDE